jgi:hypothetical protein
MISFRVRIVSASSTLRATSYQIGMRFSSIRGMRLSRKAIWLASMRPFLLLSSRKPTPPGLMNTRSAMPGFTPIAFSFISVCTGLAIGDVEPDHVRSRGDLQYTDDLLVDCIFAEAFHLFLSYRGEGLDSRRGSSLHQGH